MEIGFGVRHLNEPDDVAAVFNISIPLTVFDRNQGGVRQANYELEITRHLKREAELRINTELSKYYQKISAAFEEIKALETELLPAAKQAYDGTHTAYVEGKVGYLQVLDAQRTLFEARSQQLEALVIYNDFAVEIEALIGLPLSEVDRAEKEI
jgi:cobalt-zinc-cadmium efflux system outer membrane protein